MKRGRSQLENVLASTLGEKESFKVWWRDFWRSTSNEILIDSFKWLTSSTLFKTLHRIFLLSFLTSSEKCIDWLIDLTHFKILVISQSAFSLLQNPSQLSSYVRIEDARSVESWSTSPRQALKFWCEILLLLHSPPVEVGGVCCKLPLWCSNSKVISLSLFTYLPFKWSQLPITHFSCFSIKFAQKLNGVTKIIARCLQKTNKRINNHNLLIEISKFLSFWHFLWTKTMERRWNYKPGALKPFLLEAKGRVGCWVYSTSQHLGSGIR